MINMKTEPDYMVLSFTFTIKNQQKAENPPLTVETSFWYENQEYMVTKLGDDYVLVLKRQE